MAASPKESSRNNASERKESPAKKPFREPLKKVQVIALSHYARKEIQKEMFEFCHHRETVANFNNRFFAKRPDCFDYPSDILNSAKQGATSFHCSEELWQNPLDINTDMTPAQYNEIKIGWDFLIDIDSPYLDYSKIAAKLIIKALEMHDIQNIGIKFSGSKGFHLIVPFKSFPKEVSGELTKDQFPEWPRLMAGYLFEIIKESMNKEILKLSTREELEAKGRITSEHLCPLCKKPASEKMVSNYKCPNFKCRAEVTSMKSNRKQLRCPSCNGNMEKISEEKIYFCESCKVNTAKINAESSVIGGQRRMRKEKESFTQVDSLQDTQDAVDLVLVASRHLFRAPYSLHEKTALASIVLDKESIEDFKPSDADPLKITKTKSFMPSVKEGEAKDFLLQALDWGRKNKKETKKYEGEGLDISGLTITEDMYPSVIGTILKGVKADGRKRALSLLLSFFTSLELPQDYIEEKIETWNNKNYHPLKQGYVRSQINWHLKNKRLPPNYDKPIYKLFGPPSSSEAGIKNPINYTIKMAMKAKGTKTNKKPSKKSTK